MESLITEGGLLDGDHGFVGVNSRSYPSNLPAGYVSEGKNVHFLNGKAATRPGFHTMKFGEIDATTFPVSFPCTFSDKRGLGKVQGVGVFADPHGYESIVAAISYGVYRLTPNATPLLINYPSTFTCSGPVLLLQAFSRVLMFCGPDDPPLVWNPAEDFETGFQDFASVTQTAARGTDPDNTYGDGTTAIPNSGEAEVFNNRVYVVQGRDKILVSDIEDYTRYNAATQVFKINEGTDDNIVRLFPANETTLIVFKTGSIYLLSGAHGDLSLIAADLLTREHGLVSRDAVIHTGNDILFLSSGVGIFAISQVLDNKLQGQSIPLSRDIQPYMERINWSAASDAQMAYADNKVYLAVPFDGAVYNNAILVYDYLTQAWAGYWTSDFLDVLKFAKIKFQGKNQLFFIQGDNASDYHWHGALFMVGGIDMDWVFDSPKEISTEVLTRGYDLEMVQRKRNLRGILGLRTWNPKYTIKSKTDGVNEETTIIQDETKDRTKYKAIDKSDYNTTNSNNDHGVEGREDYSVEINSTNTVKLGSKGIAFNAFQDYQEEFPLRDRGKYLQFRLTNAQGRVEMTSAATIANLGRKGFGEKV